MIDKNAVITVPEKGAAISNTDRYRLSLLDGLSLGTVTYTGVLLRDLTARDVLDAQADAERVVRSGEKVLLVGSPARMGAELLRRQIKSLEGGDAPYQGPLSLDELGRLSVRDLDRLQAAVDALDVYASLPHTEAVTARGRDAGGDGKP